MSDRARKRLETVAAVLVALMALGGAGKAFLLLPYQVQANETAVKTLETKVDGQAAGRVADHELLVRIDERVREMQRDLRDKKANNTTERQIDHE